MSRTRDHWEYSVRNSDLITETERFNSQRDIAADISSPLLAKPGLTKGRLFGSVAAWINNDLRRGQKPRVNCEWVRIGERFYVVQIDEEDDDLSGINPMQVNIEPTVSTQLANGKIITSASKESRAEWDKLAVLDELNEDNFSSSPALYCLPVSEAVESNRAAILSDFEHLLQKNIVVRTSARKGEKAFNLPKSDCLTAQQAVDFCIKEAAKIAETRATTDLAFICHRYIASRASAWVRAEPDNPLVEVHGNWGLPDALQFGSFDIWDAHIPTEEVTEYANYKSHVLLLQSDGSWKYDRVRNDVARFLSISKSDVLNIAKRSAEISSRLGRPCNIMWFVGCLDKTGTSVNIPWYWTEAHETENPERGRHQLMEISEPSDLEKIDSIVKKYRRLALVLRPRRVELLRDNKFLSAVAEIAQPNRIPIYLQGSTLAHAYYQLCKHECIVVPAEERDHFRTRRQAYFGKLVRDKIPDRIARQKERASVATLPHTARVGFLVGKFFEEVLEAREANNASDLKTELADIYEVLRAITSQSGENLVAIAEAADEKRAKAGGFEHGTILIETSLSASKPTGSSHDEGLIVGADPRALARTTYRIPFNWFGFAEIGQPRTLHFSGTRSVVTVTLNRDSIDISLSEAAQQLDLGL